MHRKGPTVKIDTQLINYALGDKHSQIKLKIGIETQQRMETSNMIVLTLTSLIMHGGTNIDRSS